MPKLLTRLKIREVSTVDRGAGEGTHILLRKRHDNAAVIDSSMRALAKSVASIISDDEASLDEQAEALATTFEQCGDHMKSYVTRGPMVPHDDIFKDDDTGDNDIPEILRQIVNALCTANPDIGEEEALYYLLHTARGRQLTTHLSKII
jgi:hypothetical protein